MTDREARYRLLGDVVAMLATLPEGCDCEDCELIERVLSLLRYWTGQARDAHRSP